MPIAQYPSILAGQDLFASLLSSPEAVAWKAGDTQRNLTATLAADPDLSVPALANATYRVAGYLDFEGGALGGSDFKFELTSNGTLRFQVAGADTVPNPTVGNTYQGGAAISLGTNGTGVLRGASITGWLFAGSSPGSLSLLWSQNTVASAYTILHAGSFLSLRRVA